MAPLSGSDMLLLSGLGVQLPTCRSCPVPPRNSPPLSVPDTSRWLTTPRKNSPTLRTLFGKRVVFGCRWHHAGSVICPVLNDCSTIGARVNQLLAALAAGLAFARWFIVYLVMPVWTCSYIKMAHSVSAPFLSVIITFFCSLCEKWSVNANWLGINRVVFSFFCMRLHGCLNGELSGKINNQHKCLLCRTMAR